MLRMQQFEFNEKDVKHKTNNHWSMICSGACWALDLSFEQMEGKQPITVHDLLSGTPMKSNWLNVVSYCCSSTCSSNLQTENVWVVIREVYPSIGVLQLLCRSRATRTVRRTHRSYSTPPVREPGGWPRITDRVEAGRQIRHSTAMDMDVKRYVVVNGLPWAIVFHCP